MPRKKLSEDAQIREAVEHAMATMMGQSPKKALIVDGPMRPRKQMLRWLKLFEKQVPILNYLRSKGIWHEGRANVKDYPSAVKWRRKHRPQGGDCFQNASEFCLAHTNAKYYEGLYLIFKAPLDHAWVVMEDGRVLDFTHEAVIQKLKKEKAEVHVRPPLYLGIEIPHQQLAELHASAGANKPILELYEATLTRRSNRPRK